MLKVSEAISVPANEIEVHAVRSQGAGGQNVNKVASAIHLRFDIGASSLPVHLKERLLRVSDQRITKDGVVVIKAQQHRDQERNLEEALARLRELILRAATPRRRRIPTSPAPAARRRRVEGKIRRGQLKALRKRVAE